MSVSLSKGGNVSLSKEAPELNCCTLALAGMCGLLMAWSLIWMLLALW